MSSNRTSKSNYPSRYSPGGWVSAPQYITELICEKKATKDKKELPIKFWEIKEWRNYFKYQITLANKLIDEFGADAIIAAMKDSRCWKTYSLRSPFLRSIIEEKKDQLPQKPTDVDYGVSDKDRPSYKKNNSKETIVSKLKDLDEQGYS